MTPDSATSQTVTQDAELALSIIDSATSYAIFTMDSAGLIQSWSPGAQNLMGWTASDMIGKDARSIYTPEDRAQGVPEREMEEAQRTGHAEDKRWHLKRDGSRFWANGILAPLQRTADAGFVKIMRDETDRRSTEQTLAESQRRFSNMLEIAAVGIVFFDLHGGVSGANDAFLEMIGYTRAELDAGHVRYENLTPPEWRWRDELSLSELRATGESGPFEKEYFRKDGSKIWIYCAGKMLDDAIAIEFVVDITERKRAEERLRDSEARLARALEAGQIGDWEMDLRTNEVRWSHNMRRLAGLSEDTPANSRSALEIIHPDDRDRAALAMQRAVEQDEPIDITFRVIGADGQTRWITSRGRVERDEEGQPLVMAGVNFDVSTLRRTEDALRERSRQLEILNRVGAALTGELDVERLVQKVTDAAVDLVGAKFGAYFHNVLDESGDRFALYTLSGAQRSAFEGLGKPRVTDVLRVTFRNEGIVRSDDITVDPRYGLNTPLRGMPKGHLPVRSYLAAPVASRNGVVLGALLFGHPEPGRFTEQHEQLVAGLASQAAVAIDNARLFEEAQQANERLEQRVAERTAELARTYEQLHQAQKMEAVGQLTGGMAHDFNNLLAGIIGALELIQRRLTRGETESIAKYAAAAVTSANRAAALTHRLLAFSRRQPLDPKPVDANQLVKGMEDLLHRTVGEATQLEVRTTPDLWLALCDPHQLESAILNLAINARDAMPDGGVLTIGSENVTVEASGERNTPRLRPGQYVRIEVRDTGQGMPPDVLAKAFEPFFTTKPLGVGTGLGLSMVYGFARQSEGHVDMQSEVGQGTTVSIYLPRHERQRADETREPASTASQERQQRNQTALVVEDEPTLRALLVDFLQDLGYRTIEAADGAKGLAILRSDARIDFLVTDIGLPGVNGRDLATAAREHHKGIKILLMTGYAEAAAKASGFLGPGMELITKPFPLETFADRIQTMLKG